MRLRDYFTPLAPAVLAQMEAPDVTLRLRNGLTVKSHSRFLEFGSPSLRALLSGGAREIEVPLEVGSAGFLRAIDDLLPEYMRSAPRIDSFSPFKRTHRDYLVSLRYLGVPNALDIEASLRPDASLAGINREGIIFAAAHPCAACSGVAGALVSASTGKVSYDTKAIYEIMRICVGDEEAAEAMRRILGRAMFLCFERECSPN